MLKPSEPIRNPQIPSSSVCYHCFCDPSCNEKSILCGICVNLFVPKYPNVWLQHKASVRTAILALYFLILFNVCLIHRGFILLTNKMFMVEPAFEPENGTHVVYRGEHLHFPSGTCGHGHNMSIINQGNVQELLKSFNSRVRKSKFTLFLSFILSITEILLKSFTSDY